MIAKLKQRPSVAERFLRSSMIARIKQRPSMAALFQRDFHAASVADE
jgi:hypothetical protein